jgi:CheY-like chemotaxis protein
MPTILIVDDNLAMRVLLALGLKKAGVTFLAAADGNQAVEIYQENAGCIDLVLLDMEMPGLDGPKTFIALKKMDPHVRCCILAGPTANSRAKAKALGAIAVLARPIPSLQKLTQYLVKLAHREDEAPIRPTCFVDSPQTERCDSI